MFHSECCSDTQVQGRAANERVVMRLQWYKREREIKLSEPCNLYYLCTLIEFFCLNAAAEALQENYFNDIIKTNKKHHLDNVSQC